MAEADADDGAGLIFQWERRARSRWRLAGMLAASLLVHAGSFYVFQVAYTPTGTQLPALARVVLVPLDRPENAPLAHWLATNDPALTTRPAVVRCRAAALQALGSCRRRRQPRPTSPVRARPGARSGAGRRAVHPHPGVRPDDAGGADRPHRSARGHDAAAGALPRQRGDQCLGPDDVPGRSRCARRRAVDFSAGHLGQRGARRLRARIPGRPGFGCRDA